MTHRADEEAEAPQTTQFAELLRLIWTATTRATRRMEHLPALPGQHVEVLHRITEAGGLTPAQLADAMQLSRPTVSELVRRMAEDNLVERRPSESDGRSIVIMPTAHAVQVLASFRHGITEVVDMALERIPAREARQLLAATSAMDHLREQLETVASSAESGDSPWSGASWKQAGRREQLRS